MGPGASRGTKSVPGRTLGYAKIAINTQPCYTLSICFELTPFISWIEEEGASIFEGRIHNFIFHGLTRQWAGRTFCISLGVCDCFKQFLAGGRILGISTVTYQPGVDPLYPLPTGRKQRAGGCGVISIILGIAHSQTIMTVFSVASGSSHNADLSHYHWMCRNNG